MPVDNTSIAYAWGQNVFLKAGETCKRCGTTMHFSFFATASQGQENINCFSWRACRVEAEVKDVYTVWFECGESESLKRVEGIRCKEYLGSPKGD